MSTITTLSKVLSRALLAVSMLLVAVLMWAAEDFLTNGGYLQHAVLYGGTLMAVYGAYHSGRMVRWYVED